MDGKHAEFEIEVCRRRDLVMIGYQNVPGGRRCSNLVRVDPALLAFLLDAGCTSVIRMSAAGVEETLTIQQCKRQGSVLEKQCSDEGRSASAVDGSITQWDLG
ncbi:hypothetical protein BU24DRAFT_450434 [Aaosphaeria arxii CBS 175.79]|uniref:Uncharacterized protein n=1 Tax=Aaosphaeria arxii CBS 175.79 TaxID=1450172 RepID=A0A6A5XS59_9PLEO|nr:uncharacterized protein BU24DRAFT_450434 [Aaosphaeria arxii CBS 175.79]KAF2015773.1 hypothetical protein BU24DRAFT_450434 [Aaosphaeria arxii CBS 175.79]